MEQNGILPLHHQQKNHNKLKFENLEKMKEQENTTNKEDGGVFFKYLEQKFINDWLSLGFEEENVISLVKDGVMSLDINFAFEFLSTQQEMKKKKKKGKDSDEEEDGDGWNVPSSDDMTKS